MSYCATVAHKDGGGERQKADGLPPSTSQASCDTIQSTMKKTVLMGLIILLLCAAACGDDSTADVGTGSYCLVMMCTYGADCLTSGGATGKCIEIDVCNRQCLNRCDSILDSCPSDVCFQTINGGDGGCSPDACYYYGTSPDVFVCAPVGAKKVGDACDALFDCVAGAQCLEHDGSRACYATCDEKLHCGTGTCADSGLGFSVCI